MDKARSRPLSEDISQAARRVVQIFSSENLAASHQVLSPAVADLTYRALRHWGLTQVRLKRMTKRPPSPEVQALLAVAWAALETGLREPHTVVNQAVAAAKKMSHTATASFLNALLRKTLADPVAAHADWRDPVARFNAPAWWIEKIQAAYARPETPRLGQEILLASTVRPPLTVRVAARQDEAVLSYMQNLSDAGFKATRLGPTAVSLFPHVPVEQIPGFLVGSVSVQDASAQWAAQLFEFPDVAQKNPQTRLQILDACAAPGGKAIALAQRFCADIWALDASSHRLDRLRKDLPRVEPGFVGRLSVVCADLLQPATWPMPVGDIRFDGILLDAPCSASGVVRRHPEIPWKRTTAEIQQAADLQAKMLDICWTKLKPGGQLLLVTCSVFPEEGELLAQAFLHRTPDAVLLPSPGRLLPVASPEVGTDQDGFYYAKFKKLAR